MVSHEKPRLLVTGLWHFHHFCGTFIKHRVSAIATLGISCSQTAGHYVSRLYHEPVSFFLCCVALSFIKMVRICLEYGRQSST